MPILNMIYWATWWGGGWQPWANTVAYYKFEWDLKDYSGNWHDLTWRWTITYITDTWMNKQVAYFQGRSSWNSTWAVSTSFTQQLTPSTFCVRYKAKSNGGSYPNRFFMLTYNDGSWYRLTGLITAWESNADFKIRANSDYKFQTWVYPDVWGWWHCAVATIWEWYAKIYLDGEYKNQNTYSTADLSTSTPILIGSNDSYYWYNWYIGTAIIENRIRTEQEVANYYNKTKSEYGL